MELRWQPSPQHSPDQWPPGMPGAAGPGMPGWLEERLFDQRIVMIRGPLTSEAATGIAAALLTLDAAGPGTDPAARGQLRRRAERGARGHRRHRRDDRAGARRGHVRGRRCGARGAGRGGAALGVPACPVQAGRAARGRGDRYRRRGGRGRRAAPAGAGGGRAAAGRGDRAAPQPDRGRPVRRAHPAAAEARDYGLIDEIVGKEAYRPQRRERGRPASTPGPPKRRGLSGPAPFLQTSGYATLTPIERAVPATTLIAASMSFAFRSGSLRSAISLIWSALSVPTVWVSGLARARLDAQSLADQEARRRRLVGQRVAAVLVDRRR